LAIEGGDRWAVKHFKNSSHFFGTQRAARAVPIIFLRKSLQGFGILL
jgi:hypothetical protein